MKRFRNAKLKALCTLFVALPHFFHRNNIFSQHSDPMGMLSMSHAARTSLSALLEAYLVQEL